MIHFTAAILLTLTLQTDITPPCTDPHGTPGLQNAWGECITPEEYAKRFGNEALANTPSLTGPGNVLQNTPHLHPDPLQRPLATNPGDPAPTYRQLVKLKHRPQPA